MNRVEIFPGMIRYPGGKRQWYVRLLSGNNEVLNVSEGFMSKWNAKRHARRFHPLEAAEGRIKVLG